MVYPGGGTGPGYPPWYTPSLPCPGTTLPYTSLATVGAVHTTRLGVYTARAVWVAVLGPVPPGSLVFPVE